MSVNSFTHFCEVHVPAEIRPGDPVPVETKRRVNHSFSAGGVALGEAIQGQSCNRQMFSET